VSPVRPWVSPPYSKKSPNNVWGFFLPNFLFYDVF
jgi:hypothetical protein